MDDTADLFQEPHDAIAPGFMAVHGNHPEALRDLLLAWVARHPLDPLEDEWMLVQSNGVAQWLKLALAQDMEHGGLGIAAALQTELPSRFLWRAYRAVLGEGAVPATSPFDKDLLVWRLLRLLPAALDEPVFAPLARFLADDADLRKRYQLAERLADLFDQYQVYRADWLADWAAEDDRILTSRQGRQPVPPELRWQPRLWRMLLADVGPLPATGSRAAVHQRFLAAVAAWQGARPAGLPRRLVVFGISSLPQQALEVLAALARWVQVLMCVHNPCAHDWSHIVADKDLLRAERRRQQRRGDRGLAAAEVPDAQLHLHAHPLLAAWGKQGRDFIRLLDLHDSHEAYAARFAAIGQRIDLFDANARDTLLRQLQDDIRDLRPLAESRALWPAVDAARDGSIRFHATHGPQRDVEVLHDALLAAFAADPTLRPRDVIVMVPDIAAYAPHVQGVFGLLESGDARHIPYTLADQGRRHHDPLVAALESLLALPQSRVAASDVLDWLEVPALRARFGIAEADLPLLQRWIRAANVRWGLHAEQRGSLQLPVAMSHNSWDFGLQRMLLGYAVGEGAAWQGVEPLDEVGGLDAALLGPLVALLAALERHWRLLATPAAPEAWGERLRALLHDFFAADEGADGFTLLRLEGLLQDWLDACAAAQLAEPLPLSVVREHWLAQIDDGGLEQPFFAGAVTFATLMPMRAIPFRVVALLGMNDGDYPRSRVPMDFDLMGRDYRPGDRSRREDDRYLFLEALLSARQHLHISWVGRSIHDDSPRPPSVLVAQLRDHLAAGWRLVGDDALQPAEAGVRLLDALTLSHRLQPFHADYFSATGDPRLFSHAREWRAVPVAALPSTATASTPLAPWHAEGPLSLRVLADFLKCPARGFFHLRLGVFLSEHDVASDDQEPFAIDALQNWQLQDRLVQAQKLAVLAGQPRETAMAAELARMDGEGVLPAGAFSVLQQAELTAPMQPMFDTYAHALERWPHALPDAALDHLPAGLPASLRLVDWLGDLRRDAEGNVCRVLLYSGSLVKNKRWRHDNVLPFWVAHVAAHLEGGALHTHVVSKAGDITLEPLSLQEARDCWALMLAAWQQGLQAPLPFALQTGLAWLAKGGTTTHPPDPEAHEAARAAYEDNHPNFQRFSERDGNVYLARSFANFDALFADGEFARWCEAVLRPMLVAMERRATG